MREAGYSSSSKTTWFQGVGARELAANVAMPHAPHYIRKIVVSRGHLLLAIEARRFR